MNYINIRIIVILTNVPSLEIIDVTISVIIYAIDGVVIIILNSTGKIRMMADGSADFTKKLGLELDLTARGMGVRCQRFSMLIDDGVVKTLNIEGPGKFEVSDADTMLKQLG